MPPEKDYIFIVPFLFFFCIASITSQAQEANQDSTARNGSYVFLPILFHTPETGTGYGVMMQYNFRESNSRTNSRPSVIMPVVIYTSKSQLITELSYQLYFNDEKYLLTGAAGYQVFPNQFWGIGNNTPDEAEENYTPTSFYNNIKFLTRIQKGINIGLGFDFQNSSIAKKDTLLKVPGITGRNGGLVSGIGPAVNYDTRDNIYFPSQGSFHQMTIFVYNSILGSDYDWVAFNIDLRRYQTIFSNWVIAYQAYSNFIGGDPPFYRMSLLGGSRNLRGYFEGRYRDKDMLMSQVEIRSPTWYGIGLTAFTGYGDVAPEITEFTLSDFKYAFGFGLRYRLDPREKLNIRVDFGFIEGGGNFYVQIAEAF